MTALQEIKAYVKNWEKWEKIKGYLMSASAAWVTTLATMWATYVVDDTTVKNVWTAAKDLATSIVSSLWKLLPVLIPVLVVSFIVGLVIWIVKHR